MLSENTGLGNRKSVEQRGFTVVELMIATAIFSVVLLGALGGFLGIGRLFYKGVSTTSTQNVALDILNSISSDFSKGGYSAGNGASFFCAGNTSYTYVLDDMYESNLGTGPNNVGLVKEKMQGSGCSAANVSSSSTQLLGDNMRLTEITIQQIGGSSSKLYKITVRVVYGDDSSLSSRNSSQPKAGNNIVCDSNSTSSRFCSESKVTNIVSVDGYNQLDF